MIREFILLLSVYFYRLYVVHAMPNLFLGASFFLSCQFQRIRLEKNRPSQYIAIGLHLYFHAKHAGGSLSFF